MSQDPTRAAGAAPQPSDPDQIRADIAATRAELSHTVDQLAAKLHVKTQASTKVTDLTDRAAHSVKQAWQSAPSQLQQAAAAAGDTLGPTARQLSTQVRRHHTTIIAAAVPVLLAAIIMRRRHSVRQP